MSIKSILPISLSFLDKPALEVSKEFSSLPGEQFDEKPDPCIYTQFSESLSRNNFYKNRYSNILPNNETRVKLEGLKNDYINASHCLKGRVIVSQGPLEKGERGFDHHADFYHMLWTQKCSAIAMVTDYTEKGAVKCSHYLPKDKETKISGNYIITALSDNSVQEPALAELGIKVAKLFIENQDGETRTVTHYHFPSWGDCEGTAGKVVAVLVRTLLKESKPVIHCSAGIGRSGTVAAVMDAYEQIKAGKTSDSLVLDVVTALRSERRGCVQSLAQYQTVYDALQELAIEDVQSDSATNHSVATPSPSDLSPLASLNPTPRHLQPSASSNLPPYGDFKLDSTLFSKRFESMVTEIIVKCRVPYPHTLSIRGEGADLNWHTGKPLEKIDEETYAYQMKGITGKVAYKILLDDVQWEEGGNRSVTGRKQEVTPALAIPKVPVVVDIDAGSKKVFLRGTGPGMSWDKGIELKQVNSKYVLETDSDLGEFKFKILINDEQWERGENHKAQKGKTLTISPQF